MAFTLEVSWLEQNDNLALQLTDDSNTYAYNGTGWGAPNPVVTDIVASSDTTVGKYHLTLDITYTGSDAVSTTYDQINLYDLNGGAFSTVDDLVFLIDAADLSASGTAQGTDEDALLDGKYDYTYTLSEADTGTTTQTTTGSILVDGKVRVKVYDQLRQISTIYDSTEVFVPIYHHDFKDILTTLLKKSLFDSMITNVSFAREDEVLSLLDVIERLTIND